MFFYVFKGDGAAVYSPEFGRGALAGNFAVLILQILNSPTLTITLQGRAANATAWSTVGTFASITTAGLKSLSQSALTEVLRYKFEVAGSSEVSGVAIQLLAPQWQD